MNFRDFISKGESEQYRYLFELVEYGLHVESMEFLIDVVKDCPYAMCKWLAIKQLGVKKHLPSISTIIEVLKLPNVVFEGTSLHLIAAYSLGQFGEESVPYLTALLDEDISSETLIAVYDAMGETKSQTTIPYLLNGLKNTETSVAVWAGLSLSKTCLDSSSIIDSYYDLNSNNRVIALDAIIRIGDVDGLHFVVKSLLADFSLLDAMKSYNSSNWNVVCEFVSKNYPQSLNIFLGGL